MHYLLTTSLVLLASLAAPPRQEMKHMKEVQNCNLCHPNGTTSKLILLDGTPLPAPESAKLCGQCHGEKFSDWNEGMHGKQIGSWTGATRVRVNCMKCHEPHNPKFKPAIPLAAPHLPKFSVKKADDQ